MICEKCGVEVDSIRCERCGEVILRLGSFCYKCGAEIKPAAKEAEEESEELDFSNRILCSDGACIGVVNEEGLCKVCGKPYTPDA